MRCFLLHANEPGIQRLTSRLLIPHGVCVPADLKDVRQVIRWGKVAQDPQIAEMLPVLNSLKNVLRASHAGTRRDILKLHGMKIDASSANGIQDGDLGKHRYSYEYLVPVFHLEALAIFTKKRSSPLFSSSPYYDSKTDRFVETSLQDPGFHVRRAIRESVKAVYALGLDYAVVRIGIGSNGETLVLDVNPVPKLNQRLSELFTDAISRLDEQLRAEDKRMEDHPSDKTGRSPILFGADPEFILRRPDGRVVSASRYMERDGKVGCDAVVLRDRKIILPLVELRPDPSPDPRELVKNLHNTMHEANRLIRDPQLQWLTGGMPVKGISLGGHIHFSGVRLSPHLLRTLDNYLALPMALIESKNAVNRRPRYGALGDFRLQPHGGFEYRSLASWLGSPQIAGGVLSLAALIAKHASVLTRRPLQHFDVLKACYCGEKTKLLPFVQELWKDIQATTTYAEYRSELDMLYERLMNMQEWPDAEDFRKNWQIGVTAPNPTKALQKIDARAHFML